MSQCSQSSDLKSGIYLKKEGIACNSVSSEDMTESYLPTYFVIEK